MECFMDMGTCLWQKYVYLTENICYRNDYEMCTFGLLYYS